MAKVNINKVMNNEYLRVQAAQADKLGLTALHEQVTDAMQAAVERCMDMLGSTGRA